MKRQNTPVSVLSFIRFALDRMLEPVEYGLLRPAEVGSFEAESTELISVCSVYLLRFKN
jgi:hypothetical protein